ncbi:MAG: ABC transporter permease, partial [Bacteroidota bacterium]
MMKLSIKKEDVKMLAFRLAYRNLIGAGLRTWLNVFVLSVSFVVIIWHKGFLDGWDKQARYDMINWEFANGQYWQENYDPHDMFTLDNSHAILPDKLEDHVEAGNATPVLISRATIYPGGRLQNVLVKGLDPRQNILALPSTSLLNGGDGMKAIIGHKMAKVNHLTVGDQVTMRWRDVNGTFDAADIEIVDIFQTDVPSVDIGQVWISLDKLREMLKTPGEATIVVTNENVNTENNYPGWEFKDLDFLLADINEIIKSKTAGGAIFWFILLLLAMLAIFDTQVLSVFRRQKEIG